MKWDIVDAVKSIGVGRLPQNGIFIENNEMLLFGGSATIRCIVTNDGECEFANIGEGKEIGKVDQLIRMGKKKRRAFGFQSDSSIEAHLSSSTSKSKIVFKF